MTTAEQPEEGLVCPICGSEDVLAADGERFASCEECDYDGDLEEFEP